MVFFLPPKKIFIKFTDGESICTWYKDKSTAGYDNRILHKKIKTKKVALILIIEKEIHYLIWYVVALSMPVAATQVSL